MQAIGGVDIDEDCANFGCGKLCNRPFCAVRRPDAHAVTFANAQRHQPARAAIYLIAQRGPGVAQSLMQHNQRLALWEARRRAVERIADGHAKQRRIAGTAGIAPRNAATIYLPEFLLSLRRSHIRQIRHKTTCLSRDEGPPRATAPAASSALGEELAQQCALTWRHEAYTGHRSYHWAHCARAAQSLSTARVAPASLLARSGAGGEDLRATPIIPGIAVQVGVTTSRPEFQVIVGEVDPRTALEVQRLQQLLGNLKSAHTVNDDGLFRFLRMQHFGAGAAITNGDRAVHRGGHHVV